MKFAFASLVTVAAALMPLAAASVDLTFSADKFERRAGDAAPPANKPPRNPEFGRNLAKDYVLHGGEGLPEPEDVRETYPDCKWSRRDKAWLDENGVQCYLSPTYKYHAYSFAKALNPLPSLEKGACVDAKNTQDYPDGTVPRHTIAIPYLYMNNLYDRRCKIRAMVKVPKTDKHHEHWALAWVIEHSTGDWDPTGKEDELNPEDGILIDEELFAQYFNKDEPIGGVTKKPVEWFLLDVNTIG